MKRILTYIMANLVPLTIGTAFGVVLAGVVIRFVIQILIPCKQ